MAILTATEIIKQMSESHIKIEDFNESQVSPNSYDITLGDKISYYTLTDYFITIGQKRESMKFENYGLLAVEDPDNPEVSKYVRHIPVLDSKQKNTMIQESIPDDGYIMLPRILYLVESNEKVWSDRYVIEVTGCSGLARLGISVHKTAGYSNLGHEFKWVLEVEVTHPIRVYKNMKIGQIFFHTTEGDNDVQYNGSYKDKQKDDNICGSLNYIK